MPMYEVICGKKSVTLERNSSISDDAFQKEVKSVAEQVVADILKTGKQCTTDLVYRDVVDFLTECDYSEPSKYWVSLDDCISPSFLGSHELYDEVILHNKRAAALEAYCVITRHGKTLGKPVCEFLLSQFADSFTAEEYSEVVAAIEIL